MRSAAPGTCCAARPPEQAKAGRGPFAPPYLALDNHAVAQVANILQFQIHKALCEEAGEFNASDPNKPLYRCDIYQSKEAGAIME